jgi:hypothetical protein
MLSHFLDLINLEDNETIEGERNEDFKKISQKCLYQESKNLDLPHLRTKIDEPYKA